ncbi:MAG: hypothetical protein L6Q99_18725 [Planctomycetes bacterium]|nr:hypothetical protein [Planctomycetota bacterium]
MTSAPKRRLPFKLVLAACSVSILLALLEVGVRIWFAVDGRAWDGEAVRGDITARVTSLTSRLPTTQESPAPETQAGETEVLHPYFGFDTLAMQTQMSRDATASQAEKGVDVLVVGGSVSALFCGTGTRRMNELLRASPEFRQGPIRILLGGRGAYKQPQSANVLAYELSIGVEPEIVILIDGFNDVAIAAQNFAERTHPLYPWSSNWLLFAANPLSRPGVLDRMVDVRAKQRRVVELGKFALDWRLDGSALAGTLVLRRLARLQTEAGSAYDELTQTFANEHVGRVERGPPFRGGVEEARRRSVEAWMEGSISMWSACRARGIRFLHVLQPTLHDEGSKPLTDDERKNGTAHVSWMEGAKKGYPLLRAGGAELARRGVPFLDASRIFADVEQTLYYDNCHFGDEGNRLLAEAIAKRLLEDTAARGK